MDEEIEANILSFTDVRINFSEVSKYLKMYVQKMTPEKFRRAIKVIKKFGLIRRLLYYNGNLYLADGKRGLYIHIYQCYDLIEHMRKLEKDDYIMGIHTKYNSNVYEFILS